MDFKHPKLGFLPAGSLLLGGLVFFMVVRPAMGSMMRPARDMLTLQHIRYALKQITSSPDPPVTTTKAALGNLEPQPQHTSVPLPDQGPSTVQGGPDTASQRSLKPEPPPIAMLEPAEAAPEPSVATSSASPAPVPLPYQGLSKAQAGPDRASQHSLQPEPSPIAMLEPAVPEPDPSVATSSESPAPVLYRVKLQCSDGYVTLSKPPKSRKIGTFCEGLE